MEERIKKERDEMKKLVEKQEREANDYRNEIKLLIEQDEGQ